MSLYTHVLFDLDGTLVDSLPGIEAGLRRTLELLGHTLPAEMSFHWAVGPPLGEVMRRLLTPLGDDRVSQAVELYRDWYGRVGLFDGRLYPGIVELLERLRSAGRTLLVSTSKRTAFAQRVLEHFDLARYFQTVQGSEPGGTLDDKAVLVRRLLDTQEITPGQAVLVGDREHDVRAARSCGIRIVAATWGYGSAEELRSAGAITLCDHPYQVGELLTEDR